jgi:hypothetical protein
MYTFQTIKILEDLNSDNILMVFLIKIKDHKTPNRTTNIQNLQKVRNIHKKHSIFLIKKELRFLCYLKRYFCKKNKISTMDDYYSRKNKNNQE